MGGLSRRFLNLIMDNRIHGSRSLRCIDITRQQFFNLTKTAKSPNGKRSGSEEGPKEATTSRETAAVAGGQKTKQAAGDALNMEKILLPSPSFSIRGSSSGMSNQLMHFFPVADRRVVCVDQLGCGVLLEADTGNVVIMPPLHKPKSMPISLSVPCTDSDDHDGGSSSNLFVMERILKPEPSCSVEQTYQFEAFVYRKPASTYYTKSWQCHPLPSLPYVHNSKQWHSFPQISSYAVVNDGKEICISVEGLGTYCLNTKSYKWTEVGKWTLPFCGKVEHVPELKLWFGISASDQSLAAADLSAMDSQPQLLGRWKELDLPEEWKECKDSQLINLGSGKFCIARFFHTMNPKGDTNDELIDQNLAVLTGVEIVQHGHDSNDNANEGSGRVELKFLKHKSRCYKSNSSNGAITAVF